MSNLEQIRKLSQGYNKKSGEIQDISSERNQEAEQMAKDLQDMGNAIDDILANWTATEETQVIGASGQGSELRDMSAEDFVRSFIQEGGQ
ncbi:MAG: hypothetical protein V7L13_07460 [Nostoc sp.]|uniref:hypothetical protein n=1 Tax=Nostoc sp. TaxID=1180 RepID=UPI002FFC7667